MKLENLYNNISQTTWLELFTRNNAFKICVYMRLKSDSVYSANYGCTKRIKLNQIFWFNYLEFNPRTTTKHNFLEHFLKKLEDGNLKTVHVEISCIT